jgi:hypothetical protein
LTFRKRGPRRRGLTFRNVAEQQTKGKRNERQKINQTENAKNNRNRSRGGGLRIQRINRTVEVVALLQRRDNLHGRGLQRLG